MPSLKHAFHSPKDDDPAGSDLVKPSDWNAEHEFVTDNQSVYLGREDSAAGAVQEFPIEHAPGGGDDFTMMTKAQVMAVIAAAVAGIDIPVTGDLYESLAASKAGWLLCNGQTIGNVGSSATFANAAAHGLFTLMWSINGGTWPIVPARGATAEADWLAGRTLAVPDASGTVLGMLDGGKNINTIIANLGVVVAKGGKQLSVEEMPPHDHDWIPRQGNSTPSTSPGNVQGGTWDGAGPGSGKGDSTSSRRGGDPAATPPFSVAKAWIPNQPTMGCNIFIKL